MQTVITRISKIEADARRRGISISKICKAGNIDNSTFQRWKTDITAPTLEKWEKFVGAFEKLKSEQRAVRQ